MSIFFRKPLVDDEMLSRAVPTAKVEWTESDLRLVAVALSHAAVTGPVGWNHPADQVVFDALSRRVKRCADDLRREAHKHNNGADVTRLAVQSDPRGERDR